MRISNFIEDFFFLGLNDKVLFLTFENPIHDPLEVSQRHFLVLRDEECSTASTKSLI